MKALRRVKVYVVNLDQAALTLDTSFILVFLFYNNLPNDNPTKTVGGT